MKLELVTPLGVVLEVGDVEHVLAEDASGLFGIRAGHGDLVAVLTPSVLSWRLHSDPAREAHAAVRGGVLYVRKRDHEVVVQVATREALVSDDLAQLEALVEASYRAEEAAEDSDRGQATRMHAAVYRGVLRYLHPEESAGPPPVLTAPRRT